ncbi:uncharacterized protein UPF0261 [Kribbella sp. VKM Ac-2527]|uniref:Uncharacterized protein UPF0261 n=1 Tax=Kribbella caucasensis TaxID=2512215 RepID=A0A4R6KMJ6_9ACTN|nr:Tm-1-like ATP-binding domain-containing protein [Kribbella sp. VKM Ac-2527]TDO51635.1 uncharacterized protein UPF0261 [Kribbella sp. VKM Ac-2527]
MSSRSIRPTLNLPHELVLAARWWLRHWIRLSAVFLPLRGVSAIAVQGGPFYDPAADEALFDAVRKNVSPNVEVVELDHAINDPAFATAMVDSLLDYVTTDSPAPH